MDRGKAIGSVVGITLGLVTMPILGPFCAFSAMFGAWASKKAYDKCSEEPDRHTYVDTTSRILSNDGNNKLLDYLNRNIGVPRPTNHNVPPNYQNILIPRNYFPNSNLFRTQVEQRDMNIMYSPDRLIPRPKRYAHKKKQIYVDEFGQVFDPRDEG